VTAGCKSPFATRCRFCRGCLGRTAVHPDYTADTGVCPYYSPFATRCRFPTCRFADCRPARRFCRGCRLPSWLIATPTICQSLFASRCRLTAEAQDASRSVACRFAIGDGRDAIDEDPINAVGRLMGFIVGGAVGDAVGVKDDQISEVTFPH